MRLWSIHPKYLDSKGFVAVWRETLLAKHVLEGKTKGYKNHPQLTRFKLQKLPVDSINYYLSEIFNESVRRNFKFDMDKVNWTFDKTKISVTNGQINFEFNHLLKKLEKRDPVRFRELKDLSGIEVHPIFELIEGEVESWEII